MKLLSVEWVVGKGIDVIEVVVVIGGERLAVELSNILVIGELGVSLPLLPLGNDGRISRRRNTVEVSRRQGGMGDSRDERWIIKNVPILWVTILWVSLSGSEDEER